MGKRKIDFVFYARDEESAREYCVDMAKLGRKATYRYDRKLGAWVITVYEKEELGDKYDILDAEAPNTYNPAPSLFPE